MPSDTKVAIVTGSESGIGAACAVALSPTHSIGILWYESKSNAEKVAERIRAVNANCRIEMTRMDISKPEEAADVLEKFVNDSFGGRLDVLVNCAGIARYGTTLEIELGIFMEIMNVNCVGPFFLMQRAANIMIRPPAAPTSTSASTESNPTPTATKSPPAPPEPTRIISSAGTPSTTTLPPLQSANPIHPTRRLINITSVHAHTPIPNSPAYTAAKSGLAGLTNALAIDLAKYGITVNAVAPGMITTKLTGYEGVDAHGVSTPGLCPLGRPGNPEEVAGCVKWLADGEGSGYVTGQTIAIDGGFLRVNPQFYGSFGRPAH